MEDHRDAYFLWKELAIRDAVCLHVDAHLDISNFKVPEYDLDCPEVNCANFLLHACREKIVAHTIWVIPDHLNGTGPFLEWAQVELQRWMYLTLDEYASLRDVEGRIEGSLAGARLTICHSGNLPEMTLQQPYLLDIDIDYFLDPQDGLWQNPMELHALLPRREPAALTVAYSVKGGYTPLRHRYLGDLTLLAEGGDWPEAQRLWDVVQNGGEGPAWARAAALLQNAPGDHEGPDWDAAAEVDPAYRVQPVDVASMYQIRKQVDRCERWLARIQEGGSALGTLYLAAFSSFRDGDYESAAAKWRELLADPTCPKTGNTRAHVLELCGRALAKLEKFSEAVATFDEGTRIDAGNPILWREKARSLVRAGRKDEAARTFRKALSLAPDELGSLEARLELAQLYRDLGQSALGLAECRKLRRPNVPASFRSRAQLLEWRLGRGQG